MAVEGALEHPADDPDVRVLFFSDTGPPCNGASGAHTGYKVGDLPGVPPRSRPGGVVMHKRVIGVGILVRAEGIGRLFHEAFRYF